MKKVAIVGVEGSGKTVMLAGLGELYSRPDANGCFLAPRNYQTASYVAEKIARMRKGAWPTATAEDVMQGLDWTLRQRLGERQRPADMCEVSCLDFAGEVYRLAFGIKSGSGDAVSSDVESLKAYVRNADDIIVLINLRDIINNGAADARVQEAMWITNSILAYALDTSGGRREPRAAIVLSQADSYADTISACGGARGVLEKYLPHVANNYSWLDILAVSAVDKTVLDDSGNVVPAPDFQSGELRSLMDWVLAGLVPRTPPRGPQPRPRPQKPRQGNPTASRPPQQNKLQALQPPPSSGIEQFLTLRGRKNRASFWGFFGLTAIGAFMAAGIGSSTGLWVFGLVMIWPCVSMLVRRLHDMNLSGWYVLPMSLFSWISFLILGSASGTDGDNDYGPKP